MSNQETASTLSGYRQLEEERNIGTTQPLKPLLSSPKKLLLKQIEQMPSVFQPRIVGDTLATEKHIGTLMNAAMNETGNELDAVHVWWSGKRWLLLDGHHRIEAYTRLQAKGKKISAIPVQAVKGTLRDAQDVANGLNRKDKLPVSTEDKANSAWRYVFLGDTRSCRALASITGASRSNIHTMFKKRTELVEKYGDDWQEQVDGMTWLEVKTLDRESEAYEDWEDRRVNDIARKLYRAFGPSLYNQPELLAKGIERLSPHLYRGLVEWLTPIDEDDSDF
jgi:hypothetical protein